MRIVLVCCLVLLVGCDRPAPTPAAERTDSVAAPVATPAPIATTAPVEADSVEDDGEGEPEPTPPEYDPAPWSAAPLALADVPPVYPQQWRKADNRATCAMLAPTAAIGDAKPRAATFSGGWAVAYDEPGLRSAFGVAGTGLAADAGTFDGWDDSIAWADGSTASWGPEGGTGPDFLAYVQVAGQGCLYNVWSKHGSAHLVEVLESLRFVTPPPVGG
jgi:hypothetical protein